MNLKLFLLYSIPAIGLLHSCATANNWQNDDVYTLKEPEVPIGTDINDETDYSAYVYNRKTQERQQKYYSDRQPNSVYRSSYLMGPSMYMMFGNPYGMGFGYGYGNPYRYMGYYPYGSYYGFYSPYAYDPFFNSYYGYGYGYNPYWGYSPYMGMGYGYGYGYGYSPYYGYNPYGYGYGYGGYSGGGVSTGNTVYAHRGTYAGVGGASSRPNGAVQIAKPNPGTKPVTAAGNVSEKSAFRRPVAPNQTTKEVSGLSTPGSNRPSGQSTVRSQSGFNQTPVVTRTNDNVRPAAPVMRNNNGGGSVISGGRNGNGGRINTGNPGSRTPTMSTPARSGGGMSTPRPSSGGGGAIRTGGGGGGRR